MPLLDRSLPTLIVAILAVALVFGIAHAVTPDHLGTGHDEHHRSDCLLCQWAQVLLLGFAAAVLPLLELCGQSHPSSFLPCANSAPISQPGRSPPALQ